MIMMRTKEVFKQGISIVPWKEAGKLGKDSIDVLFIATKYIGPVVNWILFKLMYAAFYFVIFYNIVGCFHLSIIGIAYVSNKYDAPIVAVTDC